MKACRIHRFGAPEVISFEEVECPQPAETEVLVRVQAAGVGPWDSWVRSGKSVLPQPLPLTLGADLAGTVAAIGTGVRGFQLGQAVFGVTNARFIGACAEYAVADAGRLALKPHAVTDLDAASMPVVAVTALQMLFSHARLREGQRALILGVGGSVGSFAAQLALAHGAHVCGTDVKQGVEYARKLGVDTVIDVAEADLAERIDPVDVVIDTVGGSAQGQAFSVLKRGGYLVSSVTKPDPALAAQHGVSATFILVDVTTTALAQIAALVDAGKLEARIGPVLPLAEVRKAHEMLDGLLPRSPGKIMLSVGAH